MNKIKVNFPRWGSYNVAVEHIITKGLECEYVYGPPITKKTLEIGAKHSPDFVCTPFKYNMGCFLEAIEAGANTLIMIGGACRLNYYGELSIDYIGSTDRMNPFIVYTSATALRYRNYKKRKQNKPYVWIDTTPNENGMYDCFIFNAPLLNQISITAVFKDLRQLE